MFFANRQGSTEAPCIAGTYGGEVGAYGGKVAKPRLRLPLPTMEAMQRAVVLQILFLEGKGSRRQSNRSRRCSRRRRNSSRHSSSRINRYRGRSCCGPTPLRGPKQSRRRAYLRLSLGLEGLFRRPLMIPVAGGSAVVAPPPVPARRPLPQPPAPPRDLSNPPQDPQQSTRDPTRCFPREGSLGQSFFCRDLWFRRAAFLHDGASRFFFRTSRLRIRSRICTRSSGRRQPSALNPFKCKRKKTGLCEHVVHVFWHDWFEWHGLGMNVSLICACFGSLGTQKVPQSHQALSVLPKPPLPAIQQSSNASYVSQCGCGHALRRLPLRVEPLEWYSFLWVFFGTSVFREVVSRPRLEDSKVSREEP